MFGNCLKCIKDNFIYMKKNTKDLKQASCRAEIKAAGEDGIIEAYVSVFNNVDAYGDVIEQGAFAKSLANKLPKGVWMHNWDQPIAKTLEAREDPHGLYIKGQLILEVQKAQEAYALMKAGVVDEFSIGFYINDAEFDKENNVRRIKDITLVEWSPVLAGANPDTELISVKSEPEAEEAPASEPAAEPEVEPEFTPEPVEDEKSADLKVGKVLSEKNRQLVQNAIDNLQNLTEAIKSTLTPLQELLDATSDKSGIKVEADTQSKILRIRQACKQIDRAGEFILRITK
jgi:uncharacterized protein